MTSATFLGGTGDDLPTSIALDSQGFVYIGGTTTSRNFPVTEGAVNATAPRSATNGFVAKLNNSLTGAVFSTYLGGNGITRVTGVAADLLGNAYVTGVTDARDFPTTPGAFQAVGGSGMAFVTKLSAAGTSRMFSTFVGVGTPVGIASDLDGNAVIAGNVNTAGFPVTAGAVQTTLQRAGSSDMFLTRVNSLGALQYSTYLGDPANDQMSDMTTDGAGNVYVGGLTYASQAGSGFVTKFAGGKIAWTRLLSANGQTSVGSIEVDSAGNVLAAGTTNGTHFPTTSGAYQRCSTPDTQSGIMPIYVRLSGDGSIKYSSYLASNIGSPSWAATLPTGDVVTMSRLQTPFEQAPNIIRRYVLEAASTARVDCALNAASYRTVSVTPGMAVTLFGAGMGPVEGIAPVLENGKVPVSVGGVRVLFNDVPAPLLFVREDQINAIAPLSLSGNTAQVRIEYQGRSINPLTVDVKAADPGVFRMGSTEYGAILNQDNSVNTTENAAPRGSIVIFWTTGMGLFESTYEDGSIVGSNASPLRLPIKVMFSGVEGQVLYAGASPDMVAGIAQLNVRVPANARVSSRTPITVSAGETTVSDVAYIAVK
ncbi:MAG TPA: SBBP repeat-containing protein [Bryobacteraceae bacterium]|nr:SBBP repeat-containing protein [Bryobacteraceae bacterium]